jgi:hypothetical protein
MILLEQEGTLDLHLSIDLLLEDILLCWLLKRHGAYGRVKVSFGWVDSFHFNGLNDLSLNVFHHHSGLAVLSRL